MDGNDAPEQVRLPGHLCVPSDGHDGAPGPVLGGEVGRAASGGDDHDGRGHGLERGLHSCNGGGVGAVSGLSDLNTNKMMSERKILQQKEQNKIF